MKFRTLFLSTMLTGLPSLPCYAENGGSMQGKIYNRHSQLSVENINKATEALRVPEVTVSKLQKKIDSLTNTSQEQVEKLQELIRTDQDDAAQPEEAFDDPTRMTDSFRDALGKMKVRNTTSLSTTGELPKFPTVSLAAIVYSEDKKGYAMLHVNDKTVLVREGDKASFVDNSKIVEVRVQKINKNDIWLLVHPLNELIILR